MDFLGLGANRDAVNAARDAVSSYYSHTTDERIAASKINADDEHAGMPGWVTLTGAEATFIDLNVRAYDNLGESFAEFQDLPIGAIPIVKFRQDYEIRVNMGHLAGGPPQVKFQTGQSGVQITPFPYFSEEVLVPNLVNLNFDVEQFHEKEKALSRLAYAMRLARQKYIVNTMLNQPLQTEIAVSLPAYVNQTVSPYVGRTPFILDPQVQAGSVETTNIINASTEGGLTKNLFKAIRTQSIYMDMKPASMYISKVGKPWEAAWSQASVIAYTAGEGNQSVDKAVPPSRWEAAVNMGFDENGQNMNWFGMNIFVQALNMLPVDYFLISSDKPAVYGWNQLSGSYSDEIPLTGSQRNLSRRYEGRSIALAQTDPQLRNFIAGKLDSQ